MNATDFDLLVDNAFDFLRTAIAEVETSPKLSVIHFYSAVELLLKARLLEEHWSLVVAREPDRKKFEAGDFVSVSFEQACDRLQNIVQSAIPEPTRKSFDVVRRHRNRMVHFHHAIQAADKQQVAGIAGEQFLAWHHLHKLLATQWRDQFADYDNQIADIEHRLKSNRKFLEARFNDISAEIEADIVSGVEFQNCSVCFFAAAKAKNIAGDLKTNRCLVCGHSSLAIVLECEECGTPTAFVGGNFECPSCEHYASEDDIAKRLDDNSSSGQINCGACEGHDTVIGYADGYLCLECLDWSQGVEDCEYCNEANTGDMTESYLNGCGQCDGRSWKDD